MGVRLALGYAQIRAFQTGFHEGRTRRRHPNIVLFGCVDATEKYLHAAFLGCSGSTRNPPGEEDDFAFWTMSMNLLYKIRHGLWKIRRHGGIALAAVSRRPPEVPGIHDDIIPGRL